MTPSARSLAAALALLVPVLVSCGDDDDGGAGGTTSTSAAQTTTTIGPSTTTAAPPATGGQGCTDDLANRPGETDREPVVDVDGDGRDDEAWLYVGDEGTTTVGIDTAAGGSASHRWESASPVTRQVLVVDADRSGPVELLASDGRAVELWAFVDCRIEPVRNVGGDVYTFSLGFADVGTGVGCVEVDGERELVGLDVVDDSGDTVEWTRTVVELDGLDARNGTRSSGTFTRPADDAAIELLHEVTCGEQTMADDGLSSR